MLFAGADVLIHEATFGEEERDARRRDGPLDGAPGRRGRSRRGRLAARAHARLAAPPRRRSSSQEAREVFPATVLPRDFDTVEVPFPERGEPTLVKGGARPERPREETPAA